MLSKTKGTILRLILALALWSSLIYIVQIRQESWPSLLTCLVLSFYSFIICFIDKIARSELLNKAIAGKSVHLVALLLACWIPFILMAYPGNIRFNDTNFQINQFFGNPMENIFSSLPGYRITDHHPIFDTIVFGLFIKMGLLFFSSATIGWFIYVLFQSVLMSSAICFGLKEFDQMASNHILVNILLIVFAFIPFFPFSAMSMAKDMLSVPFLLLIFTLLLNPTKLVRSKKRFLAFCIASVLLVLTKKTGLHLVIFTVIILTVVDKRFKIIGPTTLLVALVTSRFVINAVLISSLNVSPGSKIEALAVPIQQVSRVVVDYGPNALNEWEYSAVDELIGVDTIPERFQENTSDGVKGIGSDPNVNYYPESSQLINFIKAYLSIGLRYPMAYVKAYVDLEAGWFTLNASCSWFGMLYDNEIPIQPPNGAFAIIRPEALRPLCRAVASSWTALSEHILLKPLFQLSIYTTWIPLACVLLTLKHRIRELLAPMVLLLGSFGLLMLSPVSTYNESVRYALPFIFMTPLLFLIVLNLTMSRKGQKGR